MTTRPFDFLASACARFANEHNFQSRRGVYFISNMNKVCVYSNNPLAADGVRHAELDEFRRRMEAEGIEEVGFADYPNKGEESGYSFAMILDDCEDLEATIAEIYQEVVIATAQRLVAVVG